MKTINLTISTAVIILLIVMLIAENSFAQTFTRIDTSIVCAAGYTYHGAFGDFNNDGLDDLFICSANHESEPNRHLLFVNEGNWNFRQVKEGPIVESSSLWGSHGANWGDYNNDGELDLFVASFYGSNNLLFANNGDGSFTQVLNGAVVNDGGDSGPAAWIDIENDGYIDLYVSNHGRQENFLYHNNGEGTFTRFTGGELVNFVLYLDQGMSSVDIDNDMDNDIFGYVPFERNYLYLNDGYGNFTPVDSGDIIDNEYEAYLCGWGDYNNDGYLDLFIPTWGMNWVGEYDILYHNNSDGTFTKVTGIAPVNEITGTDEGCWADFDNDGHLDLFTYAQWEAKNFLYKNNGDNTFTKLDIPAFTDDIGGHASLSDMNNDGFMDIFMSRGYGKTEPSENLIYANDGNANNWLIVKLIGTVSNKNAFGAWVKAKVTIGGSPVWQVREIGVSGLAGHTNAHFGFGDATLVDSLVIQWPAGHDTILKDVPVNQILTVTEEIPERYLRASFAVDTTMGRGELTVQFTDLSRFDPANPVNAWSWDFDGDGSEDSNEQNPVFTYYYYGEDVFDVSLSVSNGTDTATITRKEFIQIYPDWEQNLAPRGEATASSIEFIDYIAQNAIDGDLSSRWGSAHSGNIDWLKVEMDNLYTIEKIIIYWETAYATEYEIQTSWDDSNWETVHSEYSSNGSEDIINFSGTCAKYVRVSCLKKVSVYGSTYGYSIYEMEIYPANGNNCPTGIIKHTKFDDKISVYPNPFNELVTFSFVLEKSTDVQLNVHDLLGRKIVNIYNGLLDPGEQLIVWDGINSYGEIVKSGYYIYNLTVSDKSDNLKLYGKLLIAD